MANSIPNDSDKKASEEPETLRWDDDPEASAEGSTAAGDPTGQAERPDTSSDGEEGEKTRILKSVPSMEDEPKEEPETAAPAPTTPVEDDTDDADEAPTAVAAPVEGLAADAAEPVTAVPVEETKHEGPAHAEPKKKGRGKKVGIAVGAIVAGLAAVYVGGSLYFSSHFLPNTTVNGEDVSGMSSSQLASSIAEQGENYTLAISGDNLSLSVKGSDIGLSYDGDSYASSAISQNNGWTWPVEIFGSHSYTVDQGVSYDSDKLTTVVSAAVDAVDAGASQPTNATMQYNADTKQFEVVPEQYGTAVDKDSVVKAADEAVSGLSSTLELGQDELVQPTVKSDNETLKASVDKANELVSLTIPLDINGSEVSQVTPEMIAGWLTTGDDGSVSVNTEAVKTWTQGDLSKQFDSVGTTRNYTRADGKAVTVTGGTYGWEIDGATLADTISQQILAANDTAIDIPMKSTAAVWNPGGAEWKSYIDVDLSEQHARYYDDSGNIIWESDFVSGNPNEGNSTPTGVYSINSNMQSGSVELRGLDENGDGEPDYISYVTYWMPFVDNLVAFHDASWRGSFGGSIYTYNGSHGCVNLPSSAAQTLYSMVSVGTVVVVHN